jgi:hypothetical protein
MTEKRPTLPRVGRLSLLEFVLTISCAPGTLAQSLCTGNAGISLDGRNMAEGVCSKLGNVF